MSFLKDTINPPPVNDDADDYKFNDAQNRGLSGLQYLSNPALSANSNFATLGTNGTTPVTQASGDNAEFSYDWNVYGASTGEYSITPVLYPLNSTVKSASAYYINLIFTNFIAGSEFYLYQRIPSSVRQFQQSYYTFGVGYRNIGSDIIGARCDILSYYDPTSYLVRGSPFQMQPSQKTREISTTLVTQSLQDLTVNSGNYTDFRFNITNVPHGTCNLELYIIKCEHGIYTTPYIN